jgi:hypothetical protein
MISSPLAIDQKGNLCKPMRTVKSKMNIFKNKAGLARRENFRRQSVINFRKNNGSKIVQNWHKKCTKIGTQTVKNLVIF